MPDRTLVQGLSKLKPLTVLVITVTAVVAAGCRHIQFDEPAYWTVPGGMAEMVDIFNTCVEGVDATIGFHLCFGNFRGRPAPSHRSFAPFAPYFKDLKADVIHIEFANRSMFEIELWEK